MKYIFNLVFYFLFLQSMLFANNIVDISNVKSDNLLKNSYIYKDETNIETIETIKDKEFIPIIKQNLYLSVTIMTVILLK